jgi:hypothetical protein
LLQFGAFVCGLGFVAVVLLVTKRVFRSTR